MIPTDSTKIPLPSLEARLVKLAGLSHNDVTEGRVSKTFHHVLEAYRLISCGKQTHYGDYVKNLEGDPPLLQTIQLYCEIKRKFKRFDNMVKRLAAGDKLVSHDELLEVMADLGVYSILAIDLFLAQEEAAGDAEP